MIEKTKKTSSPATVLVCDPDLYQSELFKELYTDRQLGIHLAADIENSVALVGELNPAVVVLGSGDGWHRICDLVIKLREPNRQLPVVVLVDSDDSEVHHMIVDAGAICVLSKPCPPAVVLDRILDFLVDR